VGFPRPSPFCVIVFPFPFDNNRLSYLTVIGVISPSGGEIGPFLPVEQAALTQLVPSSQITTLLPITTSLGILPSREVNFFFPALLRANAFLLTLNHTHPPSKQTGGLVGGILSEVGSFFLWSFGCVPFLNLYISGATNTGLRCYELQGKPYSATTFMIVSDSLGGCPGQKIILFAYSGFALLTMFIYIFLSSKVEAIPK